MALKFKILARGTMIGLVSLGLAACGETENGSVSQGTELVAEQLGIGNCGAQESVIFSCQLESGAQVSICVTQGIGEDGGISFAQFRMGEPGEASYKFWPVIPGEGAMRWHSEAYSGGGEAQIGFTDGDKQYVAYSSVVRTNFAAGEPNDPAISDGLITMSGDLIIANETCIPGDVMSVDAEQAELFAADAHDLLVIRD